MGFEGGDFGFQIVVNFDDGGMRCKRGGRAIGQRESGGGVVQLLRWVRGQAVVKLIGVAIGAASPMKSERRENPSHGMVRMAGQSTFGSKRQHYIWAKAADVQGEFIDHTVEFLAVELSV